MSQKDDIKYKIEICDIGPIKRLDGLLSPKDQNLIFARNGTGKSFLSRAFRYIAEYNDQANLQTSNNDDNSKSLAELLVSKESEDSGDGSAKFIFSQNKKVLAKLDINKQNRNPVPEIDRQKTIFHVFSQDFVDNELGKAKYKVNLKEITQTMTVGSENIKLENARTTHEDTKKRHAEKIQSLAKILNQEKELELKNKAGINASLTQYRDINISFCFNQEPPTELPEVVISLNEIIKDLDKLKSIPADPSLPTELELLLLNGISFDEIQKILETSISPSEIAKEIVKKIDAKPDFYKAGISLIIDEKLESCPLCEQSLKDEAVKNIIITYIEYFNAAEEKAKEKLRQHYNIINDKIKDIERHEKNTNRQEKLFNDLKQYISSQNEISFENTTEEYKKSIDILTELSNIIKIKEKDLSNLYEIQGSNLEKKCKELNVKIEDINKKIINIKKSINDTGKERLELQRLACKVFCTEFRKKHKIDIGKIQDIKSKLDEQANEIQELESTGDKDSVKERVAKTLSMLLPYFFGDTYSFDKENDTIKLNGGAMPPRGNNDSLSDGEKSVLAFCYFIATIHKKVESNNDYEKLFLVFDDPVTSMSYDFIFSIVQALRNLGISKEGIISIKYKQPKENYPRPKLLILTHNSYFFNIAYNDGHGVVGRHSAFLLSKSDDKNHKISDMSEYIAPFKYQLIDIIGVVNGEEPDYTTANSIRSVLEAIQKFCSPDKKLQNFLEDIARDEDININSTLINSLSHGDYNGIMPPIPDLKKVCKDVEKIAKIFIPGQINQIKDAEKI
ncbi:MAG: AAA family ATPase [Candidatus Halichondribacter symbioticus]